MNVKEFLDFLNKNFQWNTKHENIVKLYKALKEVEEATVQIKQENITQSETDQDLY